MRQSSILAAALLAACGSVETQEATSGSVDGSARQLVDLSTSDRAWLDRMHFAGAAPQIINHPEEQTVVAGENAQFRVVATGFAPFSPVVYTL